MPSITFGPNGFEFSSIVNYGPPLDRSTSSITCNEKRFRIAVAYTNASYLEPNVPQIITISNNKIDDFDTVVPNVFSNHPTVFVNAFKIRGNDDEFSIAILNLGTNNVTNVVEISLLVLT